MDNQSLSHTKWKCQYHVVFIPKYRRFMARSVSFYGQAFADELAKYAINGLAFIQIALALIGAGIGVLIASKLIKKHFEKAGIV